MDEGEQLTGYLLKEGAPYATRSSIKYNADSLSGPKAHDGDSPNLYKFVLTTYHVSKCCN